MEAAVGVIILAIVCFAGFVVYMVAVNYPLIAAFFMVVGLVEYWIWNRFDGERRQRAIILSAGLFMLIIGVVTLILHLMKQ